MSDTLLKRLHSGDDTAFTDIYKKYAPGMLLEATFHLRDEAVSLDIVQQLFTVWWANKTLHRLNLKSASFKGYINTCVYNACLRYKKYKSRIIDVADFPEIAEEESIPERNISIPVTAKLTEVRKQALELVYIQGLRNKKAAELLGLKGPVFQHRLSVALEFLRKNYTITDFLR